MMVINSKSFFNNKYSLQMQYININNFVQTPFVVDEVSDIIKDSIEHAIGSQLYQQNMVNKWTDSVVENCLTRLCKLAKPFKYIGKADILLFS